MDNRMTVRMFQAVFGGLTPASQFLISTVLAVLDSDGVARITAGELAILMYPGEDRGAASQRVSRYRRILEEELASQGLSDILWITNHKATTFTLPHTCYRFDIEKFREMSEQAAAAAA